jgi:hypothetical protein
MALFAYLAGFFAIVAAILDWNWFFEHSRAKFFVDVLGRDGVRMFYRILACALLFLGFATA